MGHVLSSRLRAFFQKVMGSVGILFLLAVTAEGAVQKEVHKNCASCHGEQDYKAIVPKVNEICLKCHPTSLGKDHPIGVVSSVVAAELPLGEGNKITCITCHEPHGKNTTGRLLRKEFNSLCATCHKM